MNEQRVERWKAVLHYRSESGTLDEECVLEELEELHDVVELGPHWDTIEKIEVFRINHIDGVDLTVEQAASM